MPLTLDEMATTKKKPLSLDEMAAAPQQVSLDEMAARPKKSIGLMESAKRADLIDVLSKFPFSIYRGAKESGVIDAAKRLREDDYDKYKTARYEMLPMGGYSMVRPPRTKEDDIQLVTEYSKKLKEEQERGYTIPARIGKGAAELPSWMGEIYAGGAISKGHNILMRAAIHSIVQPHRLNEILGRMELQEEPEPKGTSYAKAWGRLYFENLSELTGEYLIKGTKGLWNKLPFGKQFINKLKGAWLKLGPNRTATQFVNKISKQAGYHGLLAEIGEERVNTLLQSITGVDDFGAGKDATMAERVKAGLKQDVQNMPVEIAVLSIPGATKFAVGKAISAISPEAPIVAAEPTPVEAEVPETTVPRQVPDIARPGAVVKPEKPAKPLKPQEVIAKKAQEDIAEGVKVPPKETIESAVVVASGQVFRGENHGIALEKAKEAGLIVKDETALGGIRDTEGNEILKTGAVDAFITSEGRIINRFEADRLFDVTSAEGLAKKKAVPPKAAEAVIVPYKEAIKQPKGGAVAMTKDNLQAAAAGVLARKHALNPKAVYEWAQKHNIDLEEQGAKLAKSDSGLDLDIVNDTTESLKVPPKAAEGKWKVQKRERTGAIEYFVLDKQGNDIARANTTGLISNKNELRITGVVVKPEYERQGIVTALIRQIKKDFPNVNILPHAIERYKKKQAKPKVKPAEAVEKGKRKVSLEERLANLSKRADAAFKQNDLDAMREIVQDTWELPATPATKALSRKIQILDGEMVARARAEAVTEGKEENLRRVKEVLKKVMPKNQFKRNAKISVQERMAIAEFTGEETADTAEQLFEQVLKANRKLQAFPVVVTEGKGIAKRGKKKISAKEEYKVGDVINTKGRSNMADPITIRAIQGNTLKFTDAKGVDYTGMARSVVRRLIEGGSWERAKAAPAAEAVTEGKKPIEMTRGEFIKAHKAQFSHYEGKRKLVVLSSDDVEFWTVPKESQRYGKLTKPANEVLGDIFDTHIAPQQGKPSFMEKLKKDLKAAEAVTEEIEKAKVLLQEYNIKSRGDINRLAERDVELSNLYQNRVSKEHKRVARELEKATDGKYTSNELLEALKNDEKYQVARQKSFEISEQRRPIEELHKAFDLAQAPPKAVEKAEIAEKPVPKGKPGFIDVRPLQKTYDAAAKLVEPAKIAERAFGKDPGAIIIKGIHQADVGRIEFNEADIETLDNSLVDFGEILSKYSNKVLKTLMTARGNPADKAAILLKNEALKKLAKEAPELVGVRKMITRIADNNYKYLQSVVGDDIHYVEDYFYGIYKNPEKVERFLDYWKTTKRFTKEKKLPTVADAISYGLELRDYNPVNNLRSEYMAIARLDGMIYMRDELMRTGKGRYIDTKEKAPHDWEKIKENVFKDVRVHPELAVMIRSLLSTNKLRRHWALRGLTHTNNALRTLKFSFSMFHNLNIAKQSVADSSYLAFLMPQKWVGIHKRPGKKIPIGLHKETVLRGLTRGFKKNDPIFRTPAYKDYIKHGGGHRYSIESQAERMVTNFVESLDRRLGMAFKLGALPIRIPKAYVKWLFQSYIPKVKYSKYLDSVTQFEKKNNRTPTSAEKIEIIKEQQNFYGMMNERLFGRSGTATSLMRLWFMSPGYFEGNARTILKSILQWGGEGGHRANRSRSNILNSLILSGIIATATTLIMTGKPPKKPETLEDIRDLFKGDTGKVDDKGRKIMIDFLTYDKDYWNILGQTLLGRPDKAAQAAIKRAGGMVAPSAQVALDIANIAAGRAIYDWKGDRVVEITDPFATQVLKIAAHEIKRIEPISVSVFKQSRKREQTRVLSFLTSLLGYRPTKTEKDKREQQVLHRIYSLKGQQEELYQYLATIRNPRRAVERYNKTVDSILSSPMIPRSMRKQWEPKLVIDLERYLENRVYYLSQQNRTDREIERAKNILENFGVTPDQAQEYLKRYWQRERKRTVSPLESHRVIGRTRKRKRLAERMGQ